MAPNCQELFGNRMSLSTRLGKNRLFEENANVCSRGSFPLDPFQRDGYVHLASKRPLHGAKKPAGVPTLPGTGQMIRCPTERGSQTIVPGSEIL